MTIGTQQAVSTESHRICTIKAKQELRIGTWTILPFDIEHDANEPVGFYSKAFMVTKFCISQIQNISNISSKALHT